MRAAGVETLFDVQALNVVGVVEILAKVPAGLRMAYRLLREAARRGTHVVILIDAPGFNLTLARFAKRAGLSESRNGLPMTGTGPTGDSISRIIFRAMTCGCANTWPMPLTSP